MVSLADAMIITDPVPNIIPNDFPLDLGQGRLPTYPSMSAFGARLNPVPDQTYINIPSGYPAGGGYAQPQFRPTDDVNRMLDEFLTTSHLPQETYAEQIFDDGSRSPDSDYKERATMLAKLASLRRDFKYLNIPEYGNEVSTVQLVNSYDAYHHRLDITGKVEMNKMFLILAWFIIEAVGTQWFGGALAGFSERQMKMMDTYQEYLIEMSEEGFGSFGENYPIAWRISGFIGIQGGMFFVMKLFTTYMKGSGPIAEMMQEKMLSLMSDSTTKQGLRRADATTSSHAPVASDDIPTTNDTTDMMSGLGNMFTTAIKNNPNALSDLMGMMKGVNGNSASKSKKPLTSIPVHMFASNN